MKGILKQNKKLPLLIAEVKTHSPFGFESEKSWEELFAIASEYGDIISIHTDTRWGGSFEILEKARALTQKPILAKGIHATDSEIVRALECGADYVLVVGRIPKLSDKILEQCLFEPNTLSELQDITEKLSHLSELKIVWNSRNLSDGSGKNETFSQARAIHQGWMCQASNISLISDIEKSVDAILVGQKLESLVLDISRSK